MSSSRFLSTLLNTGFSHTTGLTRAKELVVLVATRGALQTAVREAPSGARACCLQQRFRLGALAVGAPEQQAQRF